MVVACVVTFVTHTPAYKILKRIKNRMVNPTESFMKCNIVNATQLSSPHE